MKYKNNNKGFTIIELLVAVAIFSVVILGSVDIFIKSIESQKESFVESEVGNIVVSDKDGDGLWEVTVDNSDRPDLKFRGSRYLFVGPFEDYTNSYQGYPITWYTTEITDSITFELDF